jgi:hypothetical protein
MSTTNAERLRQRAERLEIPNKPISTSAVQSVEAACHKFLQKRGMIYKLTSSYSGKRVKKEARTNKAKEVADCGGELGTLPTQSDSDEQAASMTIR